MSYSAGGTPGTRQVPNLSHFYDVSGELEPAEVADYADRSIWAIRGHQIDPKYRPAAVVEIGNGEQSGDETSAVDSASEKTR